MLKPHDWQRQSKNHLKTLVFQAIVLVMNQKKDDQVYIRIESDWKRRLVRLAKNYPEADETTTMWLGRKIMKEGIVREEKKEKRRKKKKRR